MKRLALGILAHVDAGKTTLSEAMLKEAGEIRKAGRVDHGDAFLDTYALEKARGITIFSKQALIRTEGLSITLLDTPGHVDFTAEAERVLGILDAAVLLVSASDGVQSHTRTLWRLLERYRIPVFVFFNKMDLPDTDKERLLKQIRTELGGNFVDFTGDFHSEQIQEELALCEDSLMERFLAGEGTVSEEEASKLIRDRRLFPCYFGSALKMEGIAGFMEGIRCFAPVPSYGTEFGAKVFKVARDDRSRKLTFLKLTGGSLAVRTLIPEYGEKIDQIRLYSGSRFEEVQEIQAGTVAAVTGLSASKIGDVLGCEEERLEPVQVPVLTYRVLIPEGKDAVWTLERLKSLEEEDPTLGAAWEEEKKELTVRLMGQVQTEILSELFYERFGIRLRFSEGSILYRETIHNIVEGVGHFEPLRHYAEVHLILSPGERGSGIILENACEKDTLSPHWQNLIMGHLAEKTFRGVLTGAPVTDLKLTLASGKAHLKHTESGDFRQAVFRAVRNGLMQAESVLLEPYLNFVLQVPKDALGRAMTDLDRMGAEFTGQEDDGRIGVLKGLVPASESVNYADELRKYTRGEGQIALSFAEYRPCHNAAQVIEAADYDPERDLKNTADSVFCSHGAGVVIPWDQVKQHMHLPSVLVPETNLPESALPKARAAKALPEALSIDEIDAILEKTYFANRRSGKRPKQKRRYEETAKPARHKKPEQKPECILVDGYNVIFAWEDLSALARLNIDSARDALLDILCNYQGMAGVEVIAVFDAYRVAGHKTEYSSCRNIDVVYTEEAHTADSYIEYFVRENAGRYDPVVVTSDGTEQVIVRGANARLLSARDFREEVIRLAQEADEIRSAVKPEQFHTMEEKLKDVRL